MNCTTVVPSNAPNERQSTAPPLGELVACGVQQRAIAKKMSNQTPFGGLAMLARSLNRGSKSASLQDLGQPTIVVAVAGYGAGRLFFAPPPSREIWDSKGCAPMTDKTQAESSFIPERKSPNPKGGCRWIVGWMNPLLPLLPHYSPTANHSLVSLLSYSSFPPFCTLHISPSPLFLCVCVE
jgi:hypothetical protein